MFLKEQVGQSEDDKEETHNWKVSMGTGDSEH
jgi:hypothetical protein